MNSQVRFIPCRFHPHSLFGNSIIPLFFTVFILKSFKCGEGFRSFSRFGMPSGSESKSTSICVKTPSMELNRCIFLMETISCFPDFFWRDFWDPYRPPATRLVPTCYSSVSL